MLDWRKAGLIRDSTACRPYLKLFGEGAARPGCRDKARGATADKGVVGEPGSEFFGPCS